MLVWLLLVSVNVTIFLSYWFRLCPTGVISNPHAAFVVSCVVIVGCDPVDSLYTFLVEAQYKFPFLLYSFV